MARRNKKVLNLRAYRDKLLSRITLLERDARTYVERFRQIRKTLANDKSDTLRAYAIATEEIDNAYGEDCLNIEFIEKNEAIAELTLVYKMLSVERKYTTEMHQCLETRDLLRMAALSADHFNEQIAHDKMLSTWSKEHGFTKSLRTEHESNLA